MAAPVAAGIALALYLVIGDRPGEIPPGGGSDDSLSTGSGALGTVHFTRVEGSVNIQGRFAVAQDHLRQGDSIEVDQGSAFMALGQEGSVFVDSRSRLSLVHITKKTTRFRLERGRAAFRIKPSKNRKRFAVDTAAGQFRVVGTTFCVHVSSPNEYTLQVARGTVFFQPTDGQGIEVKANQELSSTHGLRPLADADHVAVEKMAELGERPDAPAPEPADDESPKTAVELRLRTEPARPSQTPGEQSYPFERNGLQKEDRPSVAELLAEVRELRENRDWAGVIRSYQKLMRLYPASLEAKTCLVPMGQIQRKRMGRPGDALRSFRTYLEASSHGALAEEAKWGIAMCFRDLGRTKEEIRTLRAFKEDYPDSLFIPIVEERLETLGQ